MMSIRQFWIYRLCLTNIFTFVFVSFLFNYNQTKQNKSLLLNPTFVNTNKFEYEKENSFYKSRFNQRLFHLGQRFSHININKLIHIQSSSTQTLTYYCSKHCGGWGDRLRGITSTYILAVLLQRQFVIDMQYPCDLSNFLLPNLINWMPTVDIEQGENVLKLDLIRNQHKSDPLDLSSKNLSEIWLKYDNIFLTTNGDHITPILKNRFFSSIISELNIRSNESTQQLLFPFLFELLFKPTAIVIDQLDRLLLKQSLHFNQSIICMHIRTGQNPTVPKDMKILFRDSIAHDMMTFIDKNLSSPSSLIFITSDSNQIQEEISKHYGNDRILSISGPIIHIDRYNTKKDSNQTLCHGFLKVISDFYFLGECDTLVKARSGFSEWAGRRRINEYSNLYTYCRGIHRITGPKWRRPHNIC
jgi:hypothetical protein